LGEGLTIKVEIHLPGMDAPVVASGRIAWVNNGERRPKPNYPTGCGVELTNFDDDGYSLMGKYVERYECESLAFH
jgi:hypothetical protein